MKQPPMMMMLIPDQVMKAIKGPDDDTSAEGEPVEEGSGEGEMEGEMGKGKGMMHGKCPVCGR
jgi:hypothetical protein